MRNMYQGFAFPIFLIMLAIALGGGGYYFYMIPKEDASVVVETVAPASDEIKRDVAVSPTVSQKETVVPHITILTPTAGSFFDINTTKKISFTWTTNYKPGPLSVTIRDQFGDPYPAPELSLAYDPSKALQEGSIDSSVLAEADSGEYIIVVCDRDQNLDQVHKGCKGASSEKFTVKIDKAVTKTTYVNTRYRFSFLYPKRLGPVTEYPSGKQECSSLLVGKGGSVNAVEVASFNDHQFSVYVVCQPLLQNQVIRGPFADAVSGTEPVYVLDRPAGDGYYRSDYVTSTGYRWKIGEVDVLKNAHAYVEFGYTHGNSHALAGVKEIDEDEWGSIVRSFEKIP